MSKWNSLVDKIKLNDVKVTGTQRIAEASNKFFSSVFLREPTQEDDAHCVGLKLPDLVISEEGIFSSLLNLDPKKSAGPDDVPNAFLNRFTEWSAKYLFIIFNASLNEGDLPNDWKVAKVVPVHKKGDKLNV